MRKSYRVVSSTFKGSQNGLYTYELTFNQSLEHTGKFSGIEKGLNDYTKNEYKEEISQNFLGFFRNIKNYLFSLNK